jgi:general secretion pathway protein C
LKGNSDYLSIVEGNIFNSKMRGKRPEPEQFQEAAPEASVAAPKVPLNMTLIGTAVGQGGASYAIIEDTKTKEQLLYRVGDLVLDDAKVAKISRNKVEIRRGNEKEVLEVSLTPEEPKPGAPAAPITSAPAAAKGSPTSNSSVRQVSRNKWMLDKREVEAAVDNLPQLLTKARIIPNFSDGKPDGFRIFAITEDSIYTKIGLQNGDILHRVNGIEVKDPSNFLKVFEQLKDETSITVDLVRNNQKETFGYEIR